MKAASVSADNQPAVHSKKLMLNTGFKYGVVGGGLSIVLFLAIWALKENPLDAGRLFDFFLLPLLIFFTLKELRDYKQGGRLAYWQGMTACFFCYATLAFISAIFILIFLTYGGTDLLVQHQQENLAVLTDDPQKWIEQVGKQAYDKALKEIEQLTALDLALDDFIKKILIGLFFSSIITLFFKK